MPPSARYQIAILDPNASGLPGRLQDTLRTRVAQLGLDPVLHLRFLDETNYHSDLQPREPLAGVYFGGDVQKDELTRVVRDLLDRFAFVLPVVDSTASYTSKVPAVLHPINGLPLDPADPKLETVAGRILEELRLVRARRVAFVSYRRNESRAVAGQIFHLLEERHFRVFLDTFCVEHGRPFQEALWNRMLDADILVFLHTKGALSSRWVEEEFARAAQLGLGVLNIVWPAHTPPPEAAVGEILTLDVGDFVPGRSPDSPDSLLGADALKRIALTTEALRARSLADRRRRVVDTFCRRTGAFSRRTASSELEVVVHPAGYLQVLRGRRKSVRVYPIIGHPDATHAREIADSCSVLHERGYLVFDSNGIDETTAAQLRWLNLYLPVRAFSTQEVEEWIPRL